MKQRWQGRDAAGSESAHCCLAKKIGKRTIFQTSVLIECNSPEPKTMRVVHGWLAFRFFAWRCLLDCRRTNRIRRPKAMAASASASSRASSFIASTKCFSLVPTQNLQIYLRRLSKTTFAIRILPSCSLPCCALASGISISYVAAFVATRQKLALQEDAPSFARGLQLAARRCTAPGPLPVGRRAKQARSARTLVLRDPCKSKADTIFVQRHKLK